MRAWARLLFVECGDGWLVEEAWRRMGKGRVFGLSTSPRLVDSAVQLRGVPGLVEFRTWEGERFPLPDRSFDCVISCASWSSYRDPAAVLHEVARVLRPGGDAYLLDLDRTPLEVPQASVSVDLPRLLADAGLVEARRHRWDQVPSGPSDCPTPVVIHACLSSHPTEPRPERAPGAAGRATRRPVGWRSASSDPQA